MPDWVPFPLGVSPPIVIGTFKRRTPQANGTRAFYGLHCVTFLINITAHPTATSCSSQPLSSAAVTREEKGKPRLQLRRL